MLSEDNFSQINQLTSENHTWHIDDECHEPAAHTWYWTVSCMAPRWTGMWGALATRPPSGPNMAHEKSSRSLMLVEMDVRCRTLVVSTVD